MKPCRRQFLQYAGAGVAAMAMAGLPGRIMALTRQELEEDTAPRKDIKGLHSVEEEILYLASLAPSVHNAQPWKVKVKGQGHFIIDINPKRYLPAVDPHQQGDHDIHGSLYRKPCTGGRIQGVFSFGKYFGTKTYRHQGC
ncbi:MAG: twin-arginine translocation signal domain-containing protein [Spirochaetota bacterium]